MKILIQLEYQPLNLTFVTILKIVKSLGIKFKILKIECDKKAESHISRKIYSISYIKSIVSSQTGMSEHEIIRETRKRPNVENRQIGMALSKELTDKRLSDIGDEFGFKDHATVIHAIKNVENLRATNRIFRAKFDKIREAI
jgi:chromosomal replication initiation ATPase DnaA